MKPKRKNVLIYSTGVVFILAVAACVFFWDSKKNSIEHVNPTMPKTKLISNPETRKVAGDFKEVGPTYVNIANTEFQVVVEDGNYKEKLIYSAVKDISLVFSQLDEVVIKKSKDNNSFHVNGKTVMSNMYLYWGDQRFYGPEIFSNSNFGNLLEYEDGYKLILSIEVLNEYKKALKFNEYHKLEINKLPEFIHYINELKNVSSLSDDEVVDLFYFVTPYLKSLTSIKIEKLRENAEGLLYYKIREPSILKYNYLNTDGGNKILVSESLFLNKENDEVVRVANLGYVESKWHLIY